jgi:hypothetical protein
MPAILAYKLAILVIAILTMVGQCVSDSTKTIILVLISVVVIAVSVLVH